MLPQGAMYNDFRLTPYCIKRNNIGGPFLYLNNLDLDKRRKLVDGHVIDLIDNLVDANEVKYINLSNCPGITNAILVHIANKCTRLIRLSVSSQQFTDVGIKAIVEKIGNNLTHLNYSYTSCTDAALESILDHCPNLEALNAEGTGITKIPHNIRLMLPSLRYANMRDNQIKSIPPSIALLDGTKVDLYIRLDDTYVDDLVEGGPDAIFKYFQDNGTLPSGIAEPPDYSIFQLIRSPPGSIPVHAPVPISEERASSQEPKIMYGEEIFDDIYTEGNFADAIDEEYEFRLRHLYDEFKERLSDNHVIDVINNSFLKAGNLEVIDLSGCDGITDVTLEYIAHHCINLYSLCVADCTQITDVGIEAIVKKVGKRLRHLSYSNCKNCTDAAFQSSVDHCPKLLTVGAENAGISKIPHDIGARLPSLCYANLKDNGIKAIPPSIALLDEVGVQLEISGNPIEDPPQHIVDEGYDAIVQYLQNNGTSPSGIAVTRDRSNARPTNAPESAPVHAPVRVAEEKSSLQERKRKYVVEIDHQLFDPEEFDGINVLHAYSEKNDANEKPTTKPTKRRKGMFELIGETTIFFVEGLLGKN